MNIRSASPELGGGLEGRLAVSVEDYNGEIYEGWIQNSITDNFAIRFAMKDRKSDGFNNNTYAVPGSGSTPNARLRTSKFGVSVPSGKPQKRRWLTSSIWSQTTFDWVVRRPCINLDSQVSTLQVSLLRTQRCTRSWVLPSRAAFPSLVPTQGMRSRTPSRWAATCLTGFGGYAGPNERDAGTNTRERRALR